MKNRWISVEDRLPDFGDHCLIVDNRKRKRRVEYAYFKCVDHRGNVFVIYDVLHDFKELSGEDVTNWMPLPEPLKNEGYETRKSDYYRNPKKHEVK